MNITKLVRHNLRQPLEKRLSAGDIEARANHYMLRGMHAAIRASVDKQLEEKRAAFTQFDKLDKYAPV